MSQYGMCVRWRQLVTAVAFIQLVLAAPSALAAGREAKEKAARKACLKGDYEKGVDILVDLFVNSKDPTYIYNQGRCLEQNRRYEDAVARFDEYLRVALNLSAADKSSAEKHIADCKGRIAEERQSLPTQPPPQPSVPPPTPIVTAPERAPTVEATPSASVVAQQPFEIPAPKRRWGLLTAGIATGAVGVGGIVTGIVMNLKANASIDDMENQVGGYSDAKANDQSSYKTISWIGYGVGAACLVTGGILIGFGMTERTGSSANVTLAPAVGPNQTGVLLRGAF